MTTLAKPEEAAADRGGSSSSPFLSVRDLSVRFSTEDGVVRAVDNLSFSVEPGTTLGIVGESGSGKSVTNLAVLGLHNPDSTEITGSIRLAGQELVGAPVRELEKLRGNTMAMIFQDPLTALSPFHTIGKQIGETYRKHTGASKKEARDRAIEMLTKVGIPQPTTRVDDYPHQFSGGMRQRAMIAMSLVCNPKLVIADEPTTALDVTVQAQILDLLKDLQQEMGTAIILITHDLGVVAKTAQDIMVMYAGRAVERGTVREVLKNPQHPYTWGLLSSMPSLTGPVDIPLRPVRGTPPSLINLPTGCPFNPRCDHREQVVGGKCTTERPPLAPETGHATACHLSVGQKQSIFIDQIQPRLG
ncbi:MULTISPECIES: ABC transporter ATP-binding protein [unclassified Kitasatospora]|uniref:ABC transporter ATP-binding protein n=1 Tax=unclassified Kitasatospora TaxID=2633591 RepID=UPI00070DDB36|nr:MULTISPECIES: ABC transporter ATP-binding protein [unclassified Kitasatospora]KQV23879.1 peptide ABC transporter ATP-binding protein [Kitasatospora sp. Root107]KRB67408.1 peptide ABC transporter ATP-binding protein [Kitasatospora sp. Root187]